MKKSDFWKIMSFLESNCDYSTLRWFEALAYYYAAHFTEIDPYIEAFGFFDEEE